MIWYLQKSGLPSQPYWVQIASSSDGTKLAAVGIPISSSPGVSKFARRLRSLHGSDMLYECMDAPNLAVYAYWQLQYPSQQLCGAILMIYRPYIDMAELAPNDACVL